MTRMEVYSLTFKTETTEAQVSFREFADNCLKTFLIFKLIFLKCTKDFQILFTRIIGYLALYIFPIKPRCRKFHEM